MLTPMEAEERYDSFKSIFMVSLPAIALNGESFRKHNFALHMHGALAAGATPHTHTLST